MLSFAAPRAIIAVTIGCMVELMNVTMKTHIQTINKFVELWEMIGPLNTRMEV